MATMSEAPHVTHVPTMTGGDGPRGGAALLRDLVHRPLAGGHRRHADLAHRGRDQVVDEVMISFTHDCEMPALLPGVKPTGRKVTIPFVVVVGFKDGRIAFERIYWDQASMLARSADRQATLPVTVPSRRRGCSIRACRRTR